MQDAKMLAVNVVTWNSLTYLPNFFASLEAQDMDEFTVTVVENASQDGTIRWLADAHPEAVVLRNFRNQGFARAHNQGIALALSRWPETEWPQRYILIANPDIECAPDAFCLLIETMESQPSLAACGPKLLRAVVRSQDEGRIESERTTILDATGIVITKSRRAYDRGAGETDRGQYDVTTDVFGLSGACVLYRASSLAEAKLCGEFFDEDFFAYKEDVDLAWRMRALGMRSAYVPSAVVWHHRSAPSLSRYSARAAWQSRQHQSPLVNRLSTRNHLWLLWKNEEWANLIVHAPRILPYEIAKFLASFLSLSSLRGMLAAFFGIFKMWRKRRALARLRRVSGSRMRAWFV